MKILVTGAGRGGTNLATELIKKMNIVNFTSNIEDRNFFTYNILMDNYGTKLATENKGYSIETIDRMMKNNTNLYIVFVVRHPIDNCLSKIVRGQPKSRGGDSIVEILAPDATITGSVEAINNMYNIHKFLSENYNNRLITFKMEDLIIDTEHVVNMIADKLNIKVSSDIYNFHKFNRNKYQKERYGDTLHVQVDLYKNLKLNFNGFFNGKSNYINVLSETLKEIIEYFNYTI